LILSYDAEYAKLPKTEYKPFPKWIFFKEVDGKAKRIKEGFAMLEITLSDAVKSTRISPTRGQHFSNAYESTCPNRDVDFFNAVAEMKGGAKIYTDKAVYYAKNVA
jgi:hypothetical protein